MVVFILAILIGLIPASIAKGKGRSFGLWWFYGAMLFIIALPHALLMQPDRAALDNRAAREGNKKCPYCAEPRKVMLARHMQGPVTAAYRMDEWHQMSNQ